MDYQMAYFNVYGNAGVLADEIQAILAGAELVDLNRQEISYDADVYLLVFEITQAAIPLKIMDVMENLEGKTILCCVICGMALHESKDSIEHNLLPFIPDECDYRGMFFCPGQIPASVMETVQTALDENPENQRARVMLEAFQHSMNHPDTDDLRELRRFIFVCQWGVKGAAWATILGQILNAAFFAVCLFRFKTIKLTREYFIPRPQIARRLASLGVSSLISQIASVFVIAVTNNLLVTYGTTSPYGPDIPMAVFGIVMKVSSLVSGITLGLAAGVQPILGYNYGSGQYPRVKKTYKLALGVGSAIMAAAFFIFQIFPEQIINLFGKESELYIEFAVKCFRVYLLACFLIPAGAVTGIFFQAIGKPVPATLLSLSRQIIFLTPAMLIFGYFMGVEGVLWAGPFSDGLSGVISLITVWLSWKKIFGKEVAKQ